MSLLEHFGSPKQMYLGLSWKKLTHPPQQQQAYKTLIYHTPPLNKVFKKTQMNKKSNSDVLTMD